MNPAAQTTEVAPQSHTTFSAENTVVLAAAAILLIGAVLWADKPPTMERTDFSVTYIGSRMVYLGMGAKLYDLDEQLKLKKSLLKDAEPLIYEHPPFEALVLAPLGALPYKTAYLVWGLINVGVWLFLPTLVRPYAPSPRDDLAYIALWFLFAPVGIALFQGQSSLILLLLYAVTFIQLKRNRDNLAGLCLGIGLFKFQFVLPFVLVFVLRRKWKFVAGFAVSAAFLGLLSVVAVGPSGIGGYVRLLSAVGAHPTNLSYGSATDMATLQGFVHGILRNRVSTSTMTLLVSVLSASVLGVTAWCWERSQQDNFDLMFAAVIVASLVTGFHMFTHDLSPLLLAMFLVMSNIARLRTAWSRAAVRGALLLFWIPPLYFILIARHCMYLLFPVLVLFGSVALQAATAGGEGKATQYASA